MTVLSTTIQDQVEAELVKSGKLAAADLAALKIRAATMGEPIFGLLINDGHVSNEELSKTIAHVTKVPYVNLSNAHVDVKTLQLLPKDIAERFMAVPLGEIDNRLVVGMLDADNLQAADYLANKIGRPIKVYAASEEGVRNVLGQYHEGIENKMSSSGLGTEAIGELVDNANARVEAISDDSPVSKIITSILQFAISNRASDVHIEPYEKELKIRCRIDGILREVMKLPKSTEPPIISRVKILSNLKIDEHRIPQDGQFSVHINNRDIDLRVAISPVVWGEQVIMRILDKSGTSFELESMGYTGRALRTIRNGLKRPNGMILTSGPTGSGKSTSMYALIQEIKNDSINIVTLEDPVEYKMPGVNQIQVNADVGLTFATGLRSILRQDPDVVMVGEIRDKETANLAVQAALTGHLVFSTLHTNSAAGILPRLLDMEIEPFLIASTVHTVIGQRLVRKLEEPEAYQSDKAETEAVHAVLNNLLPKTAAEVKAVSEDLGIENLPLSGQNAYTLYKGKNSLEAPGGYKGRLGLYEVFEIDDAIQDLILKRATSSDIQKAAQKNGMVTMQQDGYLKVLDKKTTMSEVNRVASDDSA